MANYLSKENKRKITILYFIIFIFCVWYSYDTNRTLQQKITQSQVDGVLSDYYFYKKVFSSKNKNMLIENPNYINNDDLVDEYAKSTPFYIDKKEKSLMKFNLTIQFFDKNKRHAIDIENKIASLQNEEYQYNIESNYIELFGKISDKGYVNIIKQLENSTFVQDELDSIFIKVMIIGLFNIIGFFYLLSLFKEHKKDKTKLHNDYEQLSNDAQAIAMVDTLTGASTRMKFDQDLNELIELSSRFNEQIFTFIIIDIDNFKSVNDTLGHQYGDLVLKEIAKSIRSNIRKTDHFYRWGGEEFVILMPMNNLEKTVENSNNLREKISQIYFDKLEKVTCSFGVVEFIKGDNETTIVERADELLYKAKENGKNRVEFE